MMTQRNLRIAGHVALAMLTLAGTIWLLRQAEDRMSRLTFLLLLYALAEGGWALAAYQNQRDYARNPRRPLLNEMRGLVGAEAVVAQACKPRGQVRLDGALWLAEAPANAHIPEGARVTITGYHGLVLEVRPASPSTAGEVA
jgi:membrane protein implicated in regulation of membrane protease activity